MNSYQEQYKEKLTLLLEDMRGHYTYVPDVEHDLPAFMRQYLEAEPEDRPRIQGNLQNCLNGQPYPDPHAGAYHYGEGEVEECGRIIDDYLQELGGCEGNEAAIRAAVRQACERVNGLNEKCGQYLIDTWRREELCGIIDSAAELAGAAPKQDRTLEFRMW